MKQIPSTPRIPRTLPSLFASHRSLLTEARESRELGWRREAAYYLRSAAIERTLISIQRARR